MKTACSVSKSLVLALALGLGLVASLNSCTVLNLFDPLVGQWQLESAPRPVAYRFHANQSFELEQPGGICLRGVWVKYTGHISLMFDSGEVRVWRYQMGNDGRQLTIMGQGGREVMRKYDAI